jgi:hypothetical protein
VLAVQGTVPGAEATVVWRGERFDQAYQPAWSPDGGRIAFSAWLRNGFRDILVIDLATGAIDSITSDRAVDMEPAWSKDGRYLYFDSDRTGISNIYAFDTRDRSLWQVTNVLGGAFAPSPSPDGKRLAFEAAVPEGGYDVYELMLDPSTWQPARPYLDDKPPPRIIHDHESPVSAPRPYRPLETLAPQTWTGTLNVGSVTSGSLQTGGSDALGLHSYSLALSSDTDKQAANIGASYSYTGWRPSIQLAGARTLLDRGGFRIDGKNDLFSEEDWSGTLSIGLPFESRPGTTWTFSANYNFDWFRMVNGPTIRPDPNQLVPITPTTNYTQAGVSTRVAYSHVHATTFGYGPVDGWDASVAFRLDNPAFGSTYRNFTLSYGLDWYQKLWGATPTLSLRLLGSWRAGDLVRPGGFSLGGVPAQDIVDSIINSVRTSPTGYLRGYKNRVIAGNQFHLANTEYRQELWVIERGLATLPIYIRRLNLAVLNDTGIAFDGPFDAGKDLRTSVGAALRLDAFFGSFVPGTFEIGYARGLMHDGIDETWFLLTGSL